MAVSYTTSADVTSIRPPYEAGSTGPAHTCGPRPVARAGGPGVGLLRMIASAAGGMARAITNEPATALADPDRGSRSSEAR